MQRKKVGIIGSGNVGSTLAFILSQKNICKQIVLKDINEDLANAMALDISQSLHMKKRECKISHENRWKKFNNCDIVVITAGVARKPDMSREDLLLTNAKIVSKVSKKALKYNPNAIFIIVSNPLDAMVYVVQKALKLPRFRVLGMAGILDSARMCYFIEEELKEKNISTLIIGSHGDSMVPLLKYTKVNGKKLSQVLDKESIEKIVEKTKNGGKQIVELLKNGSAYYAPSYATSIMIETILKNKTKILPCSIMLKGEYGYEDIAIGVPVLFGKDGAKKIVKLKLSSKEKEQFANSVSSTKVLLEALKLS